MKIESNMYVRYENMINKIIEIDDDFLVFESNWYDHWADEVSSMNKERFIKDYSPIFEYDLYKLLQQGDILLLHDNDYDKEYISEIIEQEERCLYVKDYESDEMLNLEYELISEEHIKVLRVLTKELFFLNSFNVR